MKNCQEEKMSNHTIEKVAGKKVVCFACFTAPNIFNSYILSKTVYKNDYKVLILSDWNCKEIYERIINGNYIWDKVILMKEAGAKRYDERLLEIKKQLICLNIKNADIVHYFQINQNSYLLTLFDYIPKKTKIIQTVFTASSYYVKEYYLYVKKLLKGRNIKININYDRVSEIWLYDKRLYIDRLLKRPIKEIKIGEYFRNKALLKEFCYELNMIFGYKYTPMKYDVLFLDQPLRRLLDEKTEKMIFKELLNEFQGMKVTVKNHPRSSLENKYKDFHVKVINENKVPWEVVLLNEIRANNVQNKVFVSYFSDTLITTHLFLSKLGINHYAIRLRKVIDQYSKIPIGDPRFEDFTYVLKKFYGKDFYDISTVDELKMRVKWIRQQR
ncbi:hypothetical protein [Inediibacterium massiliense]|uniref:hypothetical protein n=1 Tax=Inediibacterium massiliense TaxID=1658111 RepID=UPI0006B54C67|nr:hypothetical protein [Inediibacterium massiliense]